MAIDAARVKWLLQEASELASPGERAAYLDRKCGGEPDLRARVEALLAAGDHDGPVPVPETLPGSGVAQPLDSLATVAVGARPATRMAAPRTLAGSGAVEPLDSLATVAPSGSGAVEPLDSLATVAPTGDGGKYPTIAEATSVARVGGFVPGQVIAGRYTLLGVLGEGGMGTVYRAEQTRPVRRPVALKLIKGGMDSRNVLARFDAERQALAMMDHPNIAKVYDGGATDAFQPFFVMEFVQGAPITDYCDRNRLPVAARLRLMVAVCQAIQHAHQKGIIHRDLKPGNVLVTEVDGRPTPKVIDFGVAKATEFDLTDLSLGDTGAIVGTPTYMSPEQADPTSMDIDTRTDVYALGVILYELLAGSPPLETSHLKRGALIEMLRMVREVDPARPSTKVSTAQGLPGIAANRAIEPAHLERTLRGDLDWIVMKALEKDRARRYESANGLADDIQRHLASEPVLAAPPSRSYRLRKFARKHRAGVIAASLVLLALVAGVAGTTWGLFAARRSAVAERQARLDAQEKEKQAVAAAEGERLAKQAALEAAEGERLANSKILAASLEQSRAKETAEAVLGFVESRIFAAARPKGQDGGLGYDVKLADAITTALPAIEDGFPGRPLTEARLRKTIGVSFRDLGKPELAAKQFEAARKLYGRFLGPDDPETLASMKDLADSYATLGRHAEALKLREETLALRKAALGPDHPDTLASMNGVASSYSVLGRGDDALKLHEQTLALRKARLGPDQPDTLMSMYNLAGSYSALGRHADALKLHEQTLALRKARLGPDHPDTLRSMNKLAGSYLEVARHGEAIKLYEETLALRKAKLGPDHPDTLATIHFLGDCFRYVGRPAEALKVHEESLPLLKARFGPGHPDTLHIMDHVADLYAGLGRNAAALKVREEMEAAKRVNPGPDQPDSPKEVKPRPDQPETLAGKARPNERELAAARARESTSVLAERSAANPNDMYLALRVAALQASLGLDKELAATRRRILAIAEGTDNAQKAEQAAIACSLVPYADKAELEAAAGLARRSVDLRKGDPALYWSQTALGMAKYRSGRFGESAAALTPVVDRLKADPHPILDPTHEPGYTAAFYLAMSLSRQGKSKEARKLATETAAKVQTLLPRDEKDPTAGAVAGRDVLMLWLAYKEAKALIGFDPPAPATPAAK